LQIPELSVPLINGRIDFDKMTTEIDDRVEEIERDLAAQFLASKQAVDKLKHQADQTGRQTLVSY